MSKIEIEIPVDKEVDWDASAKLKQIILKNKQLIYEDICNKLFRDGHYYINGKGNLCFTVNICTNTCPNNAITEHQLECLLARNKLINVAICLNDGWKPNLQADYGYTFLLNYDNSIQITEMGVKCPYSTGKVMFKSEELANKAIEILGIPTIKMALNTFY